MRNRIGPCTESCWVVKGTGFDETASIIKWRSPDAYVLKTGYESVMVNRIKCC